MKKANIFIFGSLILATLLGRYGQAISYFLDEHMKETKPVYYLTVITMISIVLFLVTYLFTYIVFKKRDVTAEVQRLYLFVIGVIGLITSIWSLFVLIMWWE